MEITGHQAINNLNVSGRLVFLLLWLFLGVATRLLPHPPNVTAMIGLSLFSSVIFSRWLAILVILATMVVSDILLSCYYHYPLFGSWTIFSYSGVVLIVYFAYFLGNKNRLLLLISSSFFASLFYWLWTNLGVWLVSNIYPHNLAGILNCYMMALPFLKNSLLGNMLWTVIIYYVCFASFRLSFLTAGTCKKV